ncbi:3367_t:CDS:2, partial [Ambispora gerdemannii]
MAHKSAEKSETNQNNNDGSAATPVFEPILLQDHLDRLLPLVLGAEISELKELKALLWSAPETSEKLRRFANDTKINVIYITKEREDDKKEEDQSSVTYTYSITQEFTYQQNRVASVALIKLVPSLEPTRPLQPQIQFINLPGPAATGSGLSPYETLYSTIHSLFDSYVNAIGESRNGIVGAAIPMVKKKIAELELSLPHLQQNIVPRISLKIHPVVQKAAKQENIRVNVDMIDPAQLTDSIFLNKLQNDVNGWIKEIQKVTKLSRDPSS